MTGGWMTTAPHADRVAELVDVLHEQRIGCNYEPSLDPDGWKHVGDHEAVARAILTPGPVRVEDPS